MKLKTYCYATHNRLMQRTGLLILACIFCFGTLALGQSRGVQPSYSGAEANKKIPGAEFIREGQGTRYPSMVRMSETAYVSVDNFVSWLKKSLQLPAGTGLQLLRQESDKMGMMHYRFQQTHQSIPIDQGEYMMHAKDGRVLFFNGHLVDAPRGLSPTPSLDEAQALTAAMKAIGAAQYKWQSEFWQADLRRSTKDPNATYLPEGTLCWRISDVGNDFVLAWRFDIHSSTPDKFQRIYIDANTGAALKTLPLESNCTSATVNTVFNGNRTIFTEKYTANDYRLRDDCQSAIFHVRDWNSATLTANPIEIQNTTNNWTTNDERFGGSVLWLTEKAYDYWLNVHGRNSYDNGGGDVNGYINAKFDCSPPPGCVSDFNASMSFSGGTMKVGAGSGFADGYATVDIIGHEFTHAVTGATSQLVYANQSGALNESFSDIFGEMNERYVFGSNDWLLGAERSSGAIRDMSDPNNFSNPDTYLGTFWYTGTADNGGVHTNSGVQNFWFYLLVNGGSGTNDNSDVYSVSGVGTAVASFIAYVNQISLGQNATYQDSRDNSVALATFYYGACSNVTKQVTNAWYAVGVGDPFFDATASVTSNYNGRHVSCHDACDGAAAVSVVSGNNPTYSWSPSGGTGSTISGRCPGVYTVTVTNDNGAGCSINRNVTIQNTPLLVTNPAATSDYNGYNVSCNGAKDGSAAANAAGGTGPYSYSWNTVPMQTTATATGLGAGNYMVTVTDANGCVAIGNVSLSQPPPLTATAAPTTDYNGYNVRCHGGSDGAATATPLGGVAPYSYSWNTVPVQTTKTAVGLSAQMYTVTVTDLNACTASASTTLTEPPPLTIDAGPNKTVYYGYPDSACATLTATGIGGGVPPYTLMWSTSAATASITVCPTTSTTYYVTVTDKNGCTLTDSVRVCVIDVRCGNNLDKVELCHNTGSVKNPTQTLCVALPAAKNHIAHGDQLAACGTLKNCTFGGLTAKMAPAGGVYEDVELTAYPNPFADYTTIRFMIPTEGKAILGVYDVSGRKVATVFDGIAKANVVYEDRLQGSMLPAGMYFLSLKLESGETYTGKLVVTR